MEVKDLRLGNVINYCSDSISCNFEPRVIDEDFMILLLDGMYQLDTDCKPIELTEDWLLKKMSFKEVKPKRGVQKAFLYKGIRIEMSNSGNFYYKGVPKNKVHLIQNLTHALTNTELNINL